MIRLTNVSKTYRQGHTEAVVALRGVDLVINGEGTIVFAGPSGSGKTTLLSLVGCMSRPTTGRIWIHNTEVTHLPEHLLTELRRAHFGFVFQDLQLIHGLSALANVMLPAYPRSVSTHRLQERAYKLLEEFELSTKAHRRVEHLSGGEQQRVALARALINDPEFLVADEPTAHLDGRLSTQFLELVGRLRERGKTILLASHDPLVCQSSSANLIIALRDGRVGLPGSVL